MARILKALLPIAILGAGIGTAGFLYATAPQTEPTQTQASPTVVRVMVADPGRHRVTVPAMGIVRAEREVTLQPEISGMVTQQSENLVDGGLVRVGDPLIRIDARDYATALKLSKAELAAARLGVREESVQRQVAEAEWSDRPADFSEDSLSYVMREPHLDAAKARVDSVRTRISKAKRDLNKAILRAPFDAVVITESVDIGQLVGPAAPVARLAGIDRFWVQVSVPVSYLQMLNVPGVNATADQGSSAKVSQPGAAGEDPREGVVLRILPSVEERGRMAQVVVAVDDPLGLRLAPEERPTPLLVGTYVQVELKGKVLDNVVPIPRSALRDDERVFVVDSDGKLSTRRIEIAWRERGQVLVKKGLEEGDRVVLTPLPLATDGMAVEIAQDEESGETPGPSASDEPDASQSDTSPSDASPSDTPAPEGTQASTQPTESKDPPAAEDAAPPEDEAGSAKAPPKVAEAAN